MLIYSEHSMWYFALLTWQDYCISVRWPTLCWWYRLGCIWSTLTTSRNNSASFSLEGFESTVSTRIQCFIHVWPYPNSGEFFQNSYKTQIYSWFFFLSVLKCLSWNNTCSTFQNLSIHPSYLKFSEDICSIFWVITEWFRLDGTSGRPPKACFLDL